MNYRHAYHAGNFADVVKHVTLVAVLLHLRKKNKPFRVVDTHAGRGIYDLSGEEAARTQEAGQGVGRLSALSGDLPAAVATYLDLVRSVGEGNYPGSPYFAARLLRETDRLVAIEKQPEEFAELRRRLAMFPSARTAEADGYARLKALVPPPERRGLVLIDPPFENETEFADAARAMADAHRRFPTGIYMLWFPVKSQADADGFCGEAASAGWDKLLRIDVAREAALSEPGDKTRLTRAALLVANPPFGLDAQMRDAARVLEPALQAHIAIEQLAG